MSRKNPVLINNARFLSGRLEYTSVKIKIVTFFQAAVMCLTTGQLNSGGFGSGGFSAGSCGESGGSGGEFSGDSEPHNYVITGSKDHYIKVSILSSFVLHLK